MSTPRFKKADTQAQDYGRVCGIGITLADMDGVESWIGLGFLARYDAEDVASVFERAAAAIRAGKLITEGHQRTGNEICAAPRDAKGATE